jgi:hypothetical protein
MKIKIALVSFIGLIGLSAFLVLYKRSDNLCRTISNKNAKRESKSDTSRKNLNVYIKKMKKVFISAIVTIFTIGLFTSCASILSGSKQKVSFNTEPNGARVFVNGEDKNAITPCKVKVPRKREVTYTFQKDGYEDGSVSQTGSFNPWVIGNVVFGGIPGGLIDFASGAWYKLPKNVSYTFGKQVAYRNDPTIVAGEANKMVVRDKPGATALERTIIRWNFDSDPRGSRIFWRVISSIPDEVKNTNELYLTTTPYEETRSFNILGLTYENSRDVTIEIKVSKKGYEDQIKRYNVRQAIDQQEINGFFELVEKVN